ncbi:MAG: hypothetical protein AB7G48_20425 [Nitrospiraceae bacterium]
MKIKRKAGRIAKPGRPVFIVGYSFASPTITDLRFWFDLEYGGPLKIHPGQPPSSLTEWIDVSHTTWAATLCLALPNEETEPWKEQLGWRHPLAAMIMQRQVPPGEAIEAHLFGSRLARGLTLLTDGTAYDLTAGAFLNPSDWRDRPLASFCLADHVSVVQVDSSDPAHECFQTHGLSKFGMDELEVLSPRGLPGQHTIDRLLRIAEALMHGVRTPTVGSTVSLPLLALDLHVISHRTIPHVRGPLSVRRIGWSTGSPER